MSIELKQFYEFIVEFGKIYKNAAEQAKRFAIFQSNLKIIDQLNNNIQDFAEYGVTQFSDLTPEEFKHKMLGLKSRRRFGTQKELDAEIRSGAAKLQPRGLPPASSSSQSEDFFSWYKNNPYYPPVEDQGSTKMCAVYATVGALSILYSIQHKKSINLSTQQILDCGYGIVDTKSLYVSEVYNYTLRNYLAVETDYMHKRPNGAAGNCNKAAVSEGVAKIEKYWWVETERNIKNALQKNPLVTAVEGENLQFYKSGIYSNCPEDVADHAVVMVEYGVDHIPNGTDIPYYLLRNSWGINFGILGHIKVRRGTCGVDKEVDALALKIRKTAQAKKFGRCFCRPCVID